MPAKRKYKGDAKETTKTKSKAKRYKKATEDENFAEEEEGSCVCGANSKQFLHAL
jgi:hypothetical protein